jgi:hypothetical protein
MPFSDFILRQKLLNQGVNPYSGAGGPSTPGGPGTAPRGFFDRLTSAAFPVSDDGGLVTPEQQQAGSRQGLLQFGTSLLANSGSQPGPRQGLGALVGQALQQGQARAQGSIDAQLQRELLRAKVAQSRMETGGQDPAKVREYQFAKQNGYTGTYQEFLQLGQGGVGNFNPGDYTPESLNQYLASRTQQSPLGDPSLLKRYAAPLTTVRTVEGVPTVINAPRTAGGGAVTQQPLSNLPATAAAQGAIKAAESEGTATGTQVGAAKGGVQKKGIEAGNVLKLLDQADALVDVSTGSGLGSIVDSAAGFFGAAPAGAQAAGKLKVIGANLVLGLPRLEGPQSDRDTALYKEAAAQIGDDTAPAATKKAALATVRAIQEQYREQFEKGTGSSNIPAGSADVNSLVEKYRTKK